jgi:hypothetical protein
MAALRAVLSFAVVALFAAPAPAQELLSDTKLGFKVKAPTGYTRVPLKPDEEWIVGRWISDRSFSQRDTSGFSIDHKPELNVIAFPSSKVKEKVEVEKSGTGEQSKTTIVIKNPFKDYKDYLKRTYDEGGFYVAKEDKAEVEGVTVECLDIKVEKGTSGGPRKIVTWIFKGEDADFAVQFEMVESAWAKLKGEVTSCMRSFRRIAKDSGGSSGPPKTTENPFQRDEDLSPAQRAARRREAEKQMQEKLAKNLTAGWTSKKYGRVLVLTDGDEKYAAKVAENANAVLDYLDANLGYVGPGEYVRSPVVRICKDSSEERVYDKGSSGWSFDREITTSKDTGGSSHYRDYVTMQCCEHWLREHDFDVYVELPTWLEVGLRRAFEMSRSKGGKLEFVNDSWERVGLSEQSRAGKMSKAQDLVRMGGEQIYSDKNRDDECAALVRYLLTGPKKAKDALRAYIGGISTIARRDEEERKKAMKSPGDDHPKTAEEENAKFKEENTKRREAEKKHLEEVYQAAFGTWTDPDWKSFQAAYEKSIG